MSERDQRQTESPLLSDRGRTTISDSVVSQLAGMAAQEVDGVHMGGSASRAAGGILGSITGSEGQTRGVSVHVGATEVAIDLRMGVEYGRNILEVVEDVRRRISERIQSFTGLRVTEVNTTISDIVFPEGGVQRRRTLDGGATARQLPDTRTTRSREPAPAAGERETTGATQTGQTATERPPQEDETAELKPEDVAAARRRSREDETTRRTERPEEQ